MIDDDLRRRRLEVLEVHFQSEVDHDWDACLATFAGHPRYEIMALGVVHEGDEAVLAYHRAQREAFPDQRHDGVRIHVRCVGSGDTTVLLIAGFESGDEKWGRVEPAIAARARV